MTSCSLFGLRFHKTHPMSVLTVLTRMMGTLRTMMISRVVIFLLMNQTKVMKTRQWQYKMNVISNCVSSFERLLIQLNPYTNGGYVTAFLHMTDDVPKVSACYVHLCI